MEILPENAGEQLIQIVHGPMDIGIWISRYWQQGKVDPQKVDFSLYAAELKIKNPFLCVDFI